MAGPPFLPTRFFVTSGRGVSRASPLNAFDNALRSAGISHLNIVKVTSILPARAVEVNSVHLEPGTVAFAVMAEEGGEGGEVISSGLAWGFGDEYGYVFEAHGHEGPDALRARLERMVRGLEEEAGIRIRNPRYLVESLEVPEGHYGSVVVALLLL